MKVLLLENNPDDQKLIRKEIEKYYKDYELIIVENRKDFIKTLSSNKPDIVLSNYSLPDIDAKTALKITHQYYPLLPFIVITGTTSEELAIEYIKAGAYDYLLKKNIKRIGPAINLAFERYNLILENLSAYEELKKSEERFRLLAENAQDVIYRYEFVPTRGFSYVSPSAIKITGYTPEEYYNDPDLVFKLTHPNDRHLQEKIFDCEFKFDKPITLRWIKKDGTTIWTEQKITPIYDGNGKLVAIEGIARDVTERVNYQETLRENEFRFRTISSMISDYLFILDVNEKFELTPLWFSDSFYEITGYSKDEIKSPSFIFEKLIPPEEHEKVIQFTKEAFSGKPVKHELKALTKSGDTKWVRVIAYIYKTPDKENHRIFGVCEDITNKKSHEAQLENTKRFMQALIDSLPAEIAVLDYTGKIIMINKAWEEFAKESKIDLNKVGLEVNYLLVCENAEKSGCEEAKIVYQALKNIISGKLNYFEIVYPCHSNKEKRWFKLFCVPFKIENDFYIVCLHTNITDLVKLQKEITERKEHFENLAESTNTGIIVYQGEDLIYANSAACRISGYTREELLSKKFWEIVHPDHRELVRERGLRRQTGEQVPRNYEFKIITKEGKEKWIDFTGSLISWFGKPAGLGTAYDITPLKNALEKISKTEERFRTLFENAPVGIMVEDENGNILTINKEYEKITGFKREELIGQNVKILATEENLDKIKENINRILSGEVLDHIVDSIRKDGKKIYLHLIETSFDLPEGHKGVLSICKDITEKLQFENVLKESEKKFRTIFETANEGICIVDQNGLITDVNSKFCQIVGYEPGEILYRSFEQIFIAEEDLDSIKFYEKRRKAGYATSFERKLIKKNGDIIWTDISATGIFDENGEYIGSFAFLTDITEKKKLEEELKKSEEQFRLIWEKSKDAMRLTDENGKIILVNPAFCQLVNMTRDQLEGKLLSEIYTDDRKEYVIMKHIQRFQEDKIKEFFETEVTLHDGRRVWFEVNNSFLNFRGKKLLLGIFRDITERKKLIRELIRAKEEAEEANRLKSGFISMMSHEIRTPLNVILGFTSVLREIFDHGESEVSEFFNAIQNSGRRLLNTILQILDISRIEAGEFELHLRKFNLNDKIKDAINQLKVLANEKSIEFELQLNDNLPEIKADEYCLDGILINLINNAIKFSHENSKIEIKTELSDPYIKFTVTDYGIGMSEEYQKFLFQPFSQEKVGYNRPFEGTGLGLALTKKFVEMLKGKITCSSKQGVGTTFTVCFPIY